MLGAVCLGLTVGWFLGRCFAFQWFYSFLYFSCSLGMGRLGNDKRRKFSQGEGKKGLRRQVRM